MVSLFFLLGGLDSSGLTLLSQFLLSLLFCLHLVDCLDQNSLVLKLVTLGCKVEVMVNVLGDLLSLSVLFEKSSENSLSSHPENLGWHSCVSGTLSLTNTSVSSLSLGFVHSLATRARVHMDGSLDDETIAFSLVFFDPFKLN